jgi:mannose-1-phosphate guanylyltransferase
MSGEPVAAAMVLAAGHGTRMRPLSRYLPKPALPLPDGPLVGWALRQAVAASVTRVVINTWHLADTMATVARSCTPAGAELDISPEDQLMDTAGGLALARDRGLLGDRGPVLVLNGDCVLRLDLRPLLEQHCRSNDRVTLALLPHLDPTAWSRVQLDGRGRVRAIQAPGAPQAGEVPLLYPGAMLVSRAALDAVPTRACGIWQQLWQPALESGALGGVVVSGHWREVGTPQAYLETVLSQLHQQPRVHGKARVHPDAAVGVAMIGARARIDREAVVAESVVAAGARVRRGARVVRSVLLGPVEAGEGETVVNRYLAAEP